MIIQSGPVRESLVTNKQIEAVCWVKCVRIRWKCCCEIVLGPLRVKSLHIKENSCGEGNVRLVV